MSKSPAVDAYIAKSADFAKPILKRVRMLMHRACQQIEESIKWGSPFFERQGVVAYMAAFRMHVRFGFWKWKLLKDRPGLARKGDNLGMGGGKFRSMAELPSDAVLIRYIKAAVALNEQGIMLPRPARKKRPPARPPADLVAALKKNAKARATFQDLSPSQQREYIDWITEAKQDATRQRRLMTTIEWLAQGKPRNWKYLKC